MLQPSHLERVTLYITIVYLKINSIASCLFWCYYVCILKQWLLKQMSLFPQHLKASVCPCGFGFCHFCLDYVWNPHWAQLEGTWQRLRLGPVVGPDPQQWVASCPALPMPSLPSTALPSSTNLVFQLLFQAVTLSYSVIELLILCSWMLCSLVGQLVPCLNNKIVLPNTHSRWSPAT